MSLRFEWDATKDTSNRRKHGVSFEEARTVFYDDHALLLDDPDHSEQEARFILLGMSSALRLLLVCHCYRGDERCIRIISARKSNRQEQRQYNPR
ncbi:MAG: BrnT family toxin [Polyangiaceae bacterium]|nr:BrnT family toxin [Polyangiaceae bacterium]